MKEYLLSIQTPLGNMIIAAADEGLTQLEFAGNSTAKGSDDHPILLRAKEQMEEYFSGSRLNFDLPLAPKGTKFQKSVWNKLTKIPFGTTTTYGELAKQLNSSARAVGLANGSNPIAIVVPCHRVIGMNGKLTGYGGGLDKKEWLLKHEAGLLV